MAFKVRYRLVFFAIAIPVIIFVLIVLYWTAIPRHGTVEIPGEGIYTGQLRGKTFHGYGTFTSTSLGDVSYEGYWKNGVFHGQGTLAYIQGQTMKGEFREGIPHGLFKIIEADGTMHEVEFSEDSPWIPIQR